MVDKLCVIEQKNITKAVFSKAATVAGKVFDNDEIKLDFGELIFNRPKNQSLIAMTLVNFGIEAKVYLCEQEVQRLLGVEVKYLDEKYISYLITQNLSRTGLHFDKLVSWNEIDNISLVHSMLSFGEQKIDVVVDIESLKAEQAYMAMKENNISRHLNVKTELSLFETYLDSSEISSLTNDDVV
ncbi:TPA: dimethyladenosine transferase, partial [Vibrio cholerae]|nr:dimethyladenosine transferase [Vibrio cholerae]